MSRRALLRNGLIAILILATFVAAQDADVPTGSSTENSAEGGDGEGDAEFAFDLFSDIAPVLALFGEQFATQFASESLTWIDHLVFAMVPLGILTMITGAIRVSGPRIARSFIGRARENRALAEIELMSSTSAEVCELFNGRSVVRSMGKPEVAQFLIFPDDYDKVEALYDDDDRRRRDPTAAASPAPDPDLSYGIHSLQTAIRASHTRSKRETPRRMKCVDFHSHSYEVIERFFRRYVVLIWPGLQKGKAKKDVEATDSGDDTDEYDDPPRPPNLQLNLSSDHFEKAWMRKRHELFLAALFAVVLQLGLIAIAVATVHNETFKSQIRYEPKSYGLSSYVVGSFLLVFGMGLCSLAVEQSTTERSWKVLEKKSEAEGRTPDDELKHYPRLVWIQQGQTVSDQTFEPYAILAGPKRYVITSSRIEDTKDKEPAPRRKSTFKPISHHEKHDPQHGNISTTWELLTVLGVFSAGGGFVAQFIGLRGLAYPCSIAQLVAIFLMALIRALIRRRLGRIPGHTKAMAEYELEFLATHIVFCPEFRNFHRETPQNVQYLGDNGGAEVKYKWEVNLSRPEDETPFYFRPAKELNSRAAASTEAAERPKSLQGEEKSGIAGHVASVSSGKSLNVGSVLEPKLPYFQQASSQHLLRVRERLSDLCGWKSKSSEAALALVKSIEHFLDTFFPDAPKADGTAYRRRPKVAQKTLDKLEWIVDVHPPTSTGAPERQNDTISLPIRRWRLPKGEAHEPTPAEKERDGKWQVDLGKVEAALSLWMASIEAKLSEERKEPERDKGGRGEGKDWRRAESGKGMRYRYCRILGNNCGDGSLRRDLSWWVDELLVDQGHFNDKDPITVDGGAAEGSGKSFKWFRNPAIQDTDIQLIIGYHGRPPKTFLDEKNPFLHEYATISNGYLPTILAQHLFTSFMWMISEHLPRDFLWQDLSSKEDNVEIDGRHRFVLDELHETWARPTLRHRTLTKAVRQMETYGLGSLTDILLCIIPVLSVEDLLPNNAILKLVPEPQQGQPWSDIAAAYQQLLRSVPVGRAAEERFCYAVITRVMDFLYVACEPYDAALPPPADLHAELEQLITILGRYWSVVTKLAPVYEVQGRKKQFIRYFRFFKASLDDPDEVANGNRKEEEDNSKILSFTNAELADINNEFLERKLGFGKGHIRVLNAIKQEMEAKRGPQLEPKSAILPPQESQSRPRRETLTSESFGLTRDERHKQVAKADIFGWTPLHLASVHSEDIFLPVFNAAGVSDLGFHKIVTNLKRNPYHLAALAGRDENLSEMLPSDKKLETWEAASRVKAEAVKKQAVISSGIDGMTPLHCAAASGNEQCLKIILRELQFDSKYSEEDIWGRSALHITVSLGYTENARVLLQRPTLSLQALDNEGRTPLDYLFKNYLEFDPEYLSSRHKSERNEGLGESGTVNKRELLKDFIKSSRAVKARGKGDQSCLHFAVKLDDQELISELLDNGFDLEARDVDGRTPLHTAVISRASNAAVGLVRGIPSGRGDGKGYHPAADCNARNKVGATPVMPAACKGLQQVVEAILEREPKALDATDDVLNTPLHYAALWPEPSMARFLVENGCDPRARNGDDRTPAHDSLEEGNDDTTEYLLSLEGRIQRDPNTKKAESLILAAARTNCVKSARFIVKQWPFTINNVDPKYGQTAISLACENENLEMVEILLACEDVDLNIRADGWNDYTPLHIAAYNRSPTLIKLLMDSKALSVLPTYIAEVIDLLLDMAIETSTADCLREILFHDRINDMMRINTLIKLHTHTNLTASDLEDVVQEILDRIKVVPAPNLLELVKMHAQGAPANGILLKRYMDQVMKQGDTWKNLPEPLHVAAQLGDIELFRKLVDMGADPAQLDRDNWTCADIAAEYGWPEIAEELEAKYEYTRQDYVTPSTIPLPDSVSDDLSITPCKREGHEDCRVQDIKYEADDASWIIPLRSAAPIPPTKAGPYFYFEVTILDTSLLFEIAFGFDDGLTTLRSRGPGYNTQSWGYYNTGDLMVNDGWARPPSADFGEAGKFTVGDVVGVGMDRTAGEGFVTLNGVRRNVGNAFVNTDFEYGPLYPCIFIDVLEGNADLHLQVNFGGKEGHPFRYKGPFPPFVSPS
ncbi:hypothetical protein OQA88_9386 [Cercophora sp. LCS_1]